MAVLLVGRQCCVSRSAMERYDARLCRNSVMTSFAGSKSWNFCGRRGVNTSTALRPVAGSNEVMDLEGCGCEPGNRSAEEWTRRCGGSESLLPVEIHSQRWSAARLRTRMVRDCGLLADNVCPLPLPGRRLLKLMLGRGCGLIAAAPAGVDWTRMRTVRGHEQIASATCLVPVCGRGCAASVVVSNSYCMAVLRIRRDSFADAEH